MARVKIVGAGSIGNHLAHGCRQAGHDVTLCDRDPEALRRTREDIHPARYGAWDAGIRLAPAEEVAREPFDMVFVGTPPESHLPIAIEQLRVAPPRVLLIEKPLCPPRALEPCLELQERADSAGAFVGVGFNHALTEHTIHALRWLREEPLGDVLTIRAMTREHWGGIFAAHPWLDGPADSYLGFTARGGGALGEHCHAIHIWLHFAHVLGCGPVREVQAMLDWVDDGRVRYDRIAQLSVRTESGLVGTIVQDVVTRPARKWLRVEGSEGFLEWEVGADHDAVRRGDGDAAREHRVAKTRPDDFRGEIAHLGELLAAGPGAGKDSPLSLARGVEVMRVIDAAIRSSEEGREVALDPARGAGR